MPINVLWEHKESSIKLQGIKEELNSFHNTVLHLIHGMRPNYSKEFPAVLLGSVSVV
jgi:hypothetical protein